MVGWRLVISSCQLRRELCRLLPPVDAADKELVVLACSRSTRVIQPRVASKEGFGFAQSFDFSRTHRYGCVVIWMCYSASSRNLQRLSNRTDQLNAGRFSMHWVKVAPGSPPITPLQFQEPFLLQWPHPLPNECFRRPDVGSQAARRVGRRPREYLQASRH